MSVARISCPEFLDAPLRPAQEPVDVEAIGVGRHKVAAILVTKPVSVLASVVPMPNQRLRAAKHTCTCWRIGARLSEPSRSPAARQSRQALPAERPELR